MANMSQRDRAEFLHQAGREGMGLDVARKLLRYGSTLHRLAEAQCNGDWPCDNWQRAVEPCSRCDGGYVASVLLKGGLCPDCLTVDAVQAALRETCETPGPCLGATCWSAEFHGEPGGAVLTIKAPSGRELVAG